MNKIKIINLPEITAADNTTYIPVSTGATNATRKISAANLTGFENVSYLPQDKTSMEMTQARNNIGAAAKSWATIEDNLTIAYSSNPLDPNGDEVFKIENLDNPDGPDVTVNDWGYMYLRKGIYLGAEADIEGVTATDFFNLKGTTSPVQAQLNSKAPAESPTFTGTTNFEGDVQVSENVIVDGDVRAYKNTVDNWLQFSSGAKIKIQTGMNGGTPVYREFPATELSSSDLNGTQYVMVYGVGTPEENATELQAAYQEASEMPRFIGNVSYGDPYRTYYKGQTYMLVEGGTYRRMKETVSSFGNGAVVNDQYSEVISADVAKSVRSSVIVAPGEYLSSTTIQFDKIGVNVGSLTGSRDVYIPNGCSLSAGYATISGIDTIASSFSVSNSLQDITVINCSGGNYSFGGDGSTFGTFINCSSRHQSFGGNGTLTGICINCTGLAGSFGALAANSVLRDCVLNSGTYRDYSNGIVINCIDGNGDIINNPPLTVPSDSKVKLITLDDPQDSTDDPDSYALTMDDNGATLIVNDGGMTSTGLVIFDFSKFTTEELSKPFAVTIVGVGYIYAAYKTAGGPVVQLTSGASIDKTIMLCRDPRAGFDTPFARILG